MNQAQELSATIERQFSDFYELDGLIENFADVLFERLSPSLDLCIRRLGTEHAVFEYSPEDVFERLVETSTWLKDSCEALFEDYLDKRSTVEDDKLHREARKDSRSRWSGGGFGLSGALSGAAKAGLLNMGSGLLHGAFNAAADALQEEKFAEFRKDYVQSRGYRRRITNLFFELAVDLHFVEIELATRSGQEEIEVFENREKREKSEKMIANIERVGLAAAELRQALKKAIEFYPYNPRPYEVWLQNFGDAAGQMQAICDSLSLIDLTGRKQQILRNECACGTINSEEEFSARVVFLGLSNNLSLSEFKAPVEQTLRPPDREKPSVAAAGQATSQHAKAALDQQRSNQIADQREIGAFQANDATRDFSSDPDKKIYVAPDIPQKKIKKFTEKYRHSLNSDEVLFYFDDTVFGSGDAGAALSRRGLHVSLAFGEVHDLPWSEISSASISGIMNRKITVRRSSTNKDVSFVLTQSNKGSEDFFQAIQRILSMKP
ncbi:hypothetical protein [Achromobacter kerstersii]|uniref:hypothetical protein n=1 Tax=Achromobacter kerstersii TaxID=1353890 RepID=UPI00313E46D0